MNPYKSQLNEELLEAQLPIVARFLMKHLVFRIAGGVIVRSATFFLRERRQYFDPELLAEWIP